MSGNINGWRAFRAVGVLLLTWPGRVVHLLRKNMHLSWKDDYGQRINPALFPRCFVSLVIIVWFLWLRRWIVCCGSWSLLPPLKDLDQDSRAVLLFSDRSLIWFSHFFDSSVGLWCSTKVCSVHLSCLCLLLLLVLSKKNPHVPSSAHNSDLNGSF